MRNLRHIKRVMAGLMVLCLLELQTGTAMAEESVKSVYTNQEVSISQQKQRPIAVLMPTDKVAQPSYGISHAKVLYEIMEEGEISRQLSIIDDWQGLERIGNIRSCRPYYISAAIEWDPILIHFGGVMYMKDIITRPDINNLSGTSEYGIGGNAPGAVYFYRTLDRKVPHNAYISGDGIQKAANELQYSLLIREPYYNAKHFSFAVIENTLEAYDVAASQAFMIDLSRIFPYTKSAFYYSQEDGLYYKTIHGVPQVDGENGVRLGFDNVIIQHTKWKRLDKKGYLSFQMIDDTEDGYFCTRGKAIHINWRKHSDYEPTRYYDDFGNEIQLNTGKTYIAIAQKEREPVFQ